MADEEVGEEGGRGIERGREGEGRDESHSGSGGIVLEGCVLRHEGENVDNIFIVQSQIFIPLSNTWQPLDHFSTNQKRPLYSHSFVYSCHLQIIFSRV